MKCKTLRKKTMSYTDCELSSRQNSKIRDHLQHCEECIRQLEVFSQIFDNALRFNRISASPHTRTKLISRIKEYENRRNRFSDIRELFPKYTTAFGLVGLVAVGICFGIFLGNYSTSPLPGSTGFESTLPVEERYVQSSYLSAFDDLPSQSIGGIYITLDDKNSQRNIE